MPHFYAHLVDCITFLFRSENFSGYEISSQIPIFGQFKNLFRFQNVYIYSYHLNVEFSAIYSKLSKTL